MKSLTQSGAVIVETSISMVLLVIFFGAVVRVGLSMAQMTWVDSVSYQVASIAAEGGSEYDVELRQKELYILNNAQYRSSPLASAEFLRSPTKSNSVRLNSKSEVKTFFSNPLTISSFIEVANVSMIQVQLEGLDSASNAAGGTTCCGSICSEKNCADPCVACDKGDSCMYESSYCSDPDLVNFAPEAWEGK